MGSPFDAFPDATQAPQPPAAPKAMTASIWDAFPDAPKPPASAPREASGLLESLQAGFQGSASGLMWRNKLPDIFVNPDNSSWLERLASGLGQVGSEIGIMIPAAIPGSMAGSAVGGPVGGLLGAGFAMGAVPAAIRTAYMEALKSGEVKDGPGFWNIVGEVTKQALKEGTINAAAMGAGAWAKAALATRAGATAEASKAIAVGAASPLTQKAAIGYEATDLATQVTAMTTMAAWSQGHLYPSLQEVGDAAILIGGLKGAHVAAKRIMDVYEKTGKTPAEQAADAQRDPTIAEDLTKPPEPKPGDGQRSPTLSRKESQTVVSDSAFNGDSATGLENIFRSDEYDGAPIGLGSKGFTPDEIAGLERAGMATDGTMSPDQFALYDAERSARLAGRSSLKRPPPAEVPRETDGRVAMPSIQEALFRETARIDELELKARADATPLSDAERVELVGLKAKVSDLEAQLSERAKAPAANVADIVDAKFTDEQLAGARKLADDRIQELTTKAESGALTDTERTERIFLTNSLDKPGNLAKHFAIEPAGKLAPTPEAREASAQKVFEDVLGQVKAADDARRASGLAPLGEEHAQAVAALVRARVRTRAARLGVLPEDIYNEKPLQIRDETSSEVAAAEAAIPPEAPRFNPPEVDLFGDPVEVTNAPRYAVENMATTEIPLANLVLSKEVPQFKNAADEQGVVIPLGGKFDRTGVGPIQVWERLNGVLEVISGRHRLDLARRSGEETIPAQIHREADGFDARQAATLDAQLNIREEQGSVADYAQYFKDSGLSKEAADERGLLARAKGRTGFAIARDASPDLLQAHRAGKLSDEAALSISQAAPGSERLQALGIAQVNEGKSILFAVNTMKAVDLMAAERMAAGAQGDIFGFDDSAMREAAAMAKKASSKQRAISEQISAVSGASKRPELARKLGVDVQDPEGIQKKIVELKQEQYLWDNWPLYPELVAKLRALSQDALVKRDPTELVEKRPNVVIRDVRDKQGNKLGDMVEPYDGSEAGALAAAKRISQRMPEEFPEYGNVASRIGATDENGNAKFAIGFNNQEIAPATSREGRYIWGDMTAAPLPTAESIARLEAGQAANLAKFQTAKAKQEGGMTIAEYDNRFRSWDEYFRNAQNILDAQSNGIAEARARMDGDPNTLRQDPIENLPETPAEAAKRDEEAVAQAARKIERQSVTEAPAFKAWFGESKVVDKDGNPLVVYHGTNASFDIFNPHKLMPVYRLNGREIKEANSWDMGEDRTGMPEGYHYGALSDASVLGAKEALRTRLEEAERLGHRGKVDTERMLKDLQRLQEGEVMWGAENRPSGDGTWFTPDPNYSFISRDRIANDPGGNVMPVYLSIKNPIYLNASEIEGAGYSFKMEQYRKQGYDGAVFASDPADLKKTGWSGATQIVAFEPTQIKSATGNRGTFDPQDPNILYQRRPADEATPLAAGPFAGVSKEQFLGKPRITKNGNASDLKPIELTGLADVPKEPFLDKYEAKFSPDAGVVFDGDKVIASYNFGDTLVVDKAYRRSGIAEELVYQWRTRNPESPPAKERTKAAQAIQEKVWERIQTEASNILYQATALDQTKTEAFKRWSNDAPLITSADANTHDFKTGERIVVEAFHGTKRPDRVGEKFLKKRATSGPMAFHTSDPGLASSYATSKQDTSLNYENQNYEGWFKFKPKGARSPVDLDRAWFSLSPEQRATIAEKLPHVTDQTLDGDTSDVLRLGVGDNDYGLAAKSHWEYEIKNARGNILQAAKEIWLNSGSLFGREEVFLDVLKMADFPMKDLQYDPPTAEYPFVYKNYIQMQRPLVTNDIPQTVIDALEAAAKRDRSRAKPGGDMWDKGNRTLREWVVNFASPENAEKSYVWTSIPDKVTEVLKGLGYDGIVDWSGKGGGAAKPVYIPFEETQIKSAIGNKGTFSPDKNNILAQDEVQPRGSFQVAEHLITTMAGADKSTVVHELGHSWLEELKTDAAREDAPAQIKQDWGILRHELGIGEDGTISRASHEQWARTVERYLADGVAPTRELQGVFDRFKTWLLEIYNSLGNLKAEVNPELKAVLDRMLATDEELAMAKELAVPRAYVPEANAARIAAIVPPEQARAKIQPGFEAERASMEPFTDELPTGPGEAPDTTRVNYEYINAPEDVKRAMQGLAEIDQANIQKRRGGVEGVESWEATNEKVAQEMADVLEGDPRALDKYVNDVLGASATQPKVNEVLRRMKVILTGAAKDSAARRDVILSKGLDASIKEQLEYLGSLERLRMIQNEFLGQRAAVARALNQLKDTTEGTGEVGRMLEAIGVGADEVLLQSGRTPEQEQAAMKMALDEILLRYKDKSGNIRTPLDIAKLHKEIGTLKGSFKLAETMEKAGKWEKFVEGWKAGLLSGPQTPVVNLFGTASFEFMRPAVDALSAIIGMARGASPGMGETDRASMSEAVARLTGMVGGIQDGLKVGYAALKVDQQTGKVESYRPAIEGKLGEIIRMPYRLMAAGDQVTTTMYSRGEIASLAIRQAFDEGLSPGSREFAERVQALKDKPLPEMQAIADEAAARMTFNSPGGEKMRAVQTFVSKWNLEWMVPFIRTPMNVAEEMLRMSPFAPAVTSWRADIAKGGVARDRAIAELTLGAGIMALTTAYAFSGQISGSGSPDPGKNRAKAGVWQANSWLIGDTWYEYGRIQPVGTLMALAADMATTWDMMNDEERDKIPKMLALAFSNAITNQTFLQGITNVVHLMSEPDRYGGRFLQGLAGSMVPNVIGQPTAMSDPYVRQVNSMLDAVQSRIPGLRQELAPKVDWLGEPTPTKERVGVVGPSRTQKVSDDPVRKEAKRLNISVADAPKKTHIGKGTGNLGDVELTPEERTKFAEVGGKFAHDILANIVTAPGYDAIPDMVKKRIFSKVLSASHKIAAVAALPPDKRMQYLQSITEKVAQELTPEAE